MKHFNSSTCVIDTCSIITLDKVTLAHKEVLEYIRLHFSVSVCKAIQIELKRHLGKLSSREGTYWPPFLSSKALSCGALKSDEVLRHLYPSPPPTFNSHSAGERGNARVSLELLLNRKVGHVIFLTDDNNARNAFLASLCEAFPGCHLWSSSDLVFYLGAILIKEKKTTWDDVENALRDVRTGIGASQNSSELVSLAGRHRKLLRNIKLIADHWS